MKQIFLGVVVLALAACGGGSSSGGPVPNPGPSSTPVVTPTPTATPTATPAAVSQVHYSWSGTLAPGGATQTFANPLATSSPTPVPVQATLCDPRTGDCRPPGQQQYFGNDTNPTVVVSDSATPGPNGPPTLSPPPGWAYGLQNSSNPVFTYISQTPTLAGCGDTNVTFSNASGKFHECAYAVFTIGCVTSLQNQPGGGYATSVSAGYSFDTNSYVSDPAQADVYMTGPSGGSCNAAPFKDTTPGMGYSVHFPYGATGFSQITNSLVQMSPTQWTNTFTVVTFNNGQNYNGNYGCGAALNCVVLVKTKAGNIAEFEVTRDNDSGPGTQPQIGDGDWFTAGYAVANGGSFPQ